MFNCKKLLKLQIRPPSLILLITASQDRWIFPSQSWEVRNSMMMMMMIIIIITGVYKSDRLHVNNRLAESNYILQAGNPSHIQGIPRRPITVFKNSPPKVPTLSQLNPVHRLIFNFLASILKLPPHLRHLYEVISYFHVLQSKFSIHFLFLMCATQRVTINCRHKDYMKKSHWVWIQQLWCQWDIVGSLRNILG